MNTEHTLKPGLSYISERTSTLRYSDKDKNEKWLQPLSEYIPLVEVKRGQPVSVATYEDFKEVATNKETNELNGNLLDALKNSHYTFITLTNPSRHNHCIGLAYEYGEGITSNDFDAESGSLKDNLKAIHVLGNGRFDINIDYLYKTHQIGNDENIENTEYIPEFFKRKDNSYDFNNLIGKTIYVQGLQNGKSEPGLLTITKEDAYLAYNNIIQIGFISDAFYSEENINNHPLTIEVQIDGDDRGVIDSTIFEAVLGEEVVIPEKDPVRVFAIGQEADSNFEFTLRYREPAENDTVSGFIAIQRLNGKTAVIKINDNTDFNQSDLKLPNIDDEAFLNVAKYYGDIIEVDCGNFSWPTTQEYNSATPDNLPSFIKALNEAISEISSDSIKVIENGKEVVKYPKITGFIVDTKNLDKGIAAFKANEFGGIYDIYISKSLRKYFHDTIVTSHGSYENRGKAVLADIRIAERQNLLGIYDSKKYGETLRKDSKAIFIKTGLFKPNVPADKFNFEIGKAYYLSSNGRIAPVPQEYLDTVAKIGVAQTSDSFIVDLRDPRRVINGDLPVGYMKPSVYGHAEYGFVLMDGETPLEVSKYKKLFDKVQNFYGEDELSIAYRQVKDADGNDVEVETFILPKVIYSGKEWKDENQESHICYAQIKYISDGIYENSPYRIEPFMRQAFEGKDTENGIPEIDITGLISFGPGKELYFPETEALDIRLFVDLRDDVDFEEDKTRTWTEIRPGFHEFNNIEYYGFEWRVEKKSGPTEELPYGQYFLKAITSPKESDEFALGPMFQETPFSPPIPITGKPLKIFVARRDYFSRQFDVEELWDNLAVKQAVTEGEENLSKSAISEKAIVNYIGEKLKELQNSLKNELSSSNIKTPNVTTGSISIIDGNTEIDVKGLLKYNDNISFENLDNEIDNNVIITYGLLKSEIAKIKNEYDEKLSRVDAIKLNGKKLSELDENGNPISLEIPYIENQSLVKVGNEIENYGKAENKLVKVHKTSYRNNYTSDEYFYSNNRTVVKNLFIGDNKNPFTIEYDPTNESGPTISFSYGKDEDSGPVHINADASSASSSRKYKEIVTEFKDNRLNPDSGDVNDKEIVIIDDNEVEQPVDWNNYYETVTDETPAKLVKDNLKQSALQAAYVIPVASFRYKNESEQLKRWFGIITERVLQTSRNIDSFVDDTGNNSSKKFTIKIGDLEILPKDKIEFGLTTDESNSIKEYLNFLTTKNDKAQNILSSVGLLLEAAKETQERLLAVETSTFGKDSPTLPGSEKKSNYNNNKDSIPEWANQLPTILGLNRLVKALCAEVFQVPDPINLIRSGEFSETSLADYSRLDDIDKCINGSGASPRKDDDDKDASTFFLKSELGKTYVDQNSDKEISISIKGRSDAYTKDETGVKSYNTEYENDKKKYELEDGQPDRRAPFDGLNNAVNRIAKKVDTLTEHLNGSNNPVSRPELLDRIRDNIETIIKEIYNETDRNYTDTGLSDVNGSFRKEKTSKIEGLRNFTGLTDELKKKDANDPLIEGVIEPGEIVRESVTFEMEYALPKKFDGSILSGFDNSDDGDSGDSTDDSSFDSSSSF